MQQKRYQYWGFADGKPSIMWTNWFNYNGPQEPWQLNRKLKNEYRKVKQLHLNQSELHIKLDN